MLFLNGLYHGHTAWISQQRCPLFAGYQQIFVDYRGVGRSGLTTGGEFTFDDVVDDVAAICDDLARRKLVVVGFSMGGMIALRLCERRPDLVGRLVLMCSGRRPRLQVTSMVTGAVELLRRGADPRFLFQMLYPWNHSEAYLEKVRSAEPMAIEGYLRHNADVRGFLQLLRALGNRPDRTQSCRSVEVPTLVIGSDGDAVFPLELQHDLARSIAGSVLHVLSSSGHSAFVEQPEAVNRVIAEFLLGV
jgi:3-oxoadipate enol-lactonase